MALDKVSHNEYIAAFLAFMKTGEKESVTPYLNGSRPAEFLSVYRNGSMSASVSALQSNFPSLLKLWGEDYFSEVAKAYVNAVPPSSATLVGYGFAKEKANENFHGDSNLSFKDFLQQNISELAEQFPYVSDICRLDQAWLESLNENGESFLTLSAVQSFIAEGVDLGELPLVLVESSRVVTLTYNIFDVWEQLRFGSLAKNDTIALNEQQNTVIFWQADLQVQAKPLSKVEAIFISTLQRTASFSEASEQALSVDEGFDLSSLFADLLNAQLLQIHSEN